MRLHTTDADAGGTVWAKRRRLGSFPVGRCFNSLAVLVVLVRTFLVADAFTSCTFPSAANRPSLQSQTRLPTITKHPSSFTYSTGGMSKRWAATAETSSEEGGVVDDEEEEGVPAASCNLIKACVGTGVLTLPWGVAATSDVPKALIPAAGLLMVTAALSGYSFFMIGRICDSNGASTLGDAWEKEIGAKSAWVISAACFLCALGCAITYSILLGDSFCSLATAAGLKGWLASRQASILAITLSTLYPLCSLQSLGSLAPVSLVGTAGIFFTCVFMAVRSLPGGPYSLPDGSFLKSVPAEFRPSFGKMGASSILSPSALILGSMAAASYLAHFNAPAFFKSLGKRRALPRFGLTTLIGFSSVALINILMMAFGFLTFGGNSSDIILNNYSHFDAGAGICRFLMAVSVIGSYPFMLAAMKSSVLQVSHKERETSGRYGRMVTRSLLAFITSIALVIRDAGFLVSLNGAVMGSIITYIIPPILYRRSSARRIQEGSLSKSKRVRVERASSMLLIGFGVAAAVGGAAVTVVNSYFPHYLVLP